LTVVQTKSRIASSVETSQERKPGRKRGGLRGCARASAPGKYCVLRLRLSEAQHITDAFDKPREPECRTPPDNKSTAECRRSKCRST